MRDSGPFDGRNNREAMPDIIAWLESRAMAKATVNYRLRDWLISRQRYWGAPIPYRLLRKLRNRCPCPKAAARALPRDVTFREGHGNPLAGPAKPSSIAPAPSAASPRAARPTRWTLSWIRAGTSCATAIRTTPAPFDPAMVKHWMPVDQYIGGIEHATMHLIYARFFTMVLHDIGLIDFDEPFTRLFCQGMVCKMAYYCETHKWLHEDQSWKDAARAMSSTMASAPIAARPSNRK
jgi:leucyl-tRNA synthetase